MIEGVKKSLLKWLLCGLLATVTLAVCVPVADNPFINLDDADYVINNLPIHQGVTPASVSWAFRSFYSNNWHPLTWLSHALDCQLYGLDPVGHHLTNLAFHIANTVLLFLLMVNLTGRVWAGAFVAMLFGVHPMHVESVAWVAERKDVLSGFFFLLTLLAYARYVELVREQNRWRWPVYGLTLLLFALGLMSKPMLVTLPCLLLLLDYWPLARFQLPVKSQPSKVFRRLALEKIPFFVLTALSCKLTMMAQTAAIKPVASFPLLARLAQVPVAYAWYVFKLFWPVDHSIYYLRHAGQPGEAVAGALLLLGLVTGLVIWQARRRPVLLVGWLWFLVMLMPVAGFVQAGDQSYAERYTYLPYIGLFIMLAWGVPALPWVRRLPQLMLGFAAVAVIGVCCKLTAAQVRVWNSAEALFKQAVDEDPGNEEAWILYALQFNHAGNTDRAIECVRQALTIDPGNFVAYNSLGRFLVIKESYDEAQSAFASARSAVTGAHPETYKSLTADTYKNEADMYLKMGKPEEAITNLESSLALEPDQPLVLVLLGQTCLQINQADKAAAAFTTALQLVGDNDTATAAEMGLAMIDGSAGRDAAAIGHYRRVLVLSPDSAAALNNLAWMLATDADPGLRNGAEAVRLAERACKLTKYRVPFFIGTLAAADAEAGKFNDAVTNAKKAHDVALAQGLKELAAKNEKLVELFNSGHAFHEQPQPAP